MAQNDAGLISGKIRELTRLIRETRLADTSAFEPLQTLDSFSAKNGIAEKSARKIRAHARLEELSQALKGVYSEIPSSTPASQNAFAFALLPGTPPRFWVDLTSFVVMVDDGKTYQFLKDTRDGRLVLNESDDLEGTASAITDYVAERIVEQEAETKPEAEPPLQSGTGSDALADEGKFVQDEITDLDAVPVAQVPVSERELPQQPETPPTPIIIQPAPAQTDWVKLFLAFSLGVFVGAVTLFLLAWFQTPAAL